MQAPVLDRPPPPAKPPKLLKSGGDRYYIKAMCNVRRANLPAGEVWGFSKHISITTRVENVAKRETQRRFADGDFQISPVQCIFIPGEEPEKSIERVFWKFGKELRMEEE
jgi:hypothetical protein